jgi:thiamine-monophosphate kinase
VFSGGDDYELCFTLPPTHLDRVVAQASGLDLGVTVIGRIVADPGIHLPGLAPETVAELAGGYRHF